MSGKYDSTKFSQPTKLDLGLQILVKLGSWYFRHSKLYSFCTFGSVAISLSQIRVKNSWVLEKSILPHWECVCCSKLHPGTWGIATSLEIAVRTHIHVPHGTKTTSVFLPADGEAALVLLPSLLLGSTVKPENTYSCILKVTGQVWKHQKRMSININHCYHQRSSLLI